MADTYFLRDKDGIILNLKIIPNSSKNEIAGILNNFIKIKINASPEKGKANDELLSFLSKKFNIKKADIRILKGEKSREKKVLINCFDINKIEKVLLNEIKGG